MNFTHFLVAFSTESGNVGKFIRLNSNVGKCAFLTETHYESLFIENLFINNKLEHIYYSSKVSKSK